MGSGDIPSWYISGKVKELANGVHLVAEDEGVELWVLIDQGKAIDFRALDADGSELGTIQLIEPSRHLGRPTHGELRPREEKENPDPGPVIVVGRDDGGPGGGGPDGGVLVPPSAPVVPMYVQRRAMEAISVGRCALIDRDDIRLQPIG